jgi:hypothetical protein
VDFIKICLIQAEENWNIFAQICGTTNKELVTGGNYKYHKTFATAAKITHKNIQHALMQYLVKKAGRLPHPCLPLVMGDQVNRLEANFSNHWLIQSSRLHCHICSTQRIIREDKWNVIYIMSDLVLVTIFKSTTRNSSWNVVYMGVGVFEHISPNSYII